MFSLPSPQYRTGTHQVFPPLAAEQGRAEQGRTMFAPSELGTGYVREILVGRGVPEGVLPRLERERGPAPRPGPESRTRKKRLTGRSRQTGIAEPVLGRSEKANGGLADLRRKAHTRDLQPLLTSTGRFGAEVLRAARGPFVETPEMSYHFEPAGRVQA